MALGAIGLNGVNVLALVAVVFLYSSESAIARGQRMVVHFALERGKGKILWSFIIIVMQNE